jgi:hypothetical protein
MAKRGCVSSSLQSRDAGTVEFVLVLRVLLRVGGGERTFDIAASGVLDVTGVHARVVASSDDELAELGACRGLFARRTVVVLLVFHEALRRRREMG